MTTPAPARRAAASNGMASHSVQERHTEPQRLILDGFPSVEQVRLLGPNNSTTNSYALGRARKAVQNRVKVAAGLQGIHPMAPPVSLTLRYVFPDDRHRDADNFAVIGKPVVDGLVRSEILSGDNGARLPTPRVEFVKERGARRLEVILAPAIPAADADGEEF